MPFLIPAIPGIIGAVGGALGSKLTGPGAAGQAGQQGATNIMNQATNTGSDFLKSSKGALDQSTNYYANILSGNPSAVSQSISPELRTLSSAYRNNMNTLSTFAPMGGGRSNMISQLPFQQAGKIADLISSSRNNAAQGLFNIGGVEGGLGTNLFNTGVGAAGNLMGYDIKNRDTQFGQGAAIGSGVYNIAKSLDWAKVFGGGGG